MTDAAYRAGHAKIDWTVPLPAPVRSRGVRPAKSDFPCPMFTRDFSDPVQSMADGKFYSSKAALALSHKAQNNPSGQDFIELGNEAPPTFKEYVPDEKAERDTIKRAIADYQNGWRPEVVALDE